MSSTQDPRPPTPPSTPRQMPASQKPVTSMDKLKQYTLAATDKIKAVGSDNWIHIGIFIWLFILTVIVGVYLDRLLKWQKSQGSTASSTGGTGGTGTTAATAGPPKLSDGAITWLVFLIIFLLVLLVSAFMYLKENIVVEERPYVFLMAHGLLFISILATSVNAIKKING
jgi:hypothetical protein